uniref:Protein XRP2 n=2 Tax=Ornithodoros turicata TaxID=34597 RepID=A0A2R5L6E3_9ACAR
MGCFQTKLKSMPEEGSEGERRHSGSKTYSWDHRKREINPKGYTVENLKGQTVGRAPGTVNGQQFIIQNCEDSNIYIFDHLNTVTVDDCNNCNIFLGPTKASIFLRDCKDCRVAAICQQLRTRDCHRVDCFLCCATQPSIESSSEMRFGCLCISYKQLEDQFKYACLSPFNNNWQHVYDFTPDSVEPNWTLFPHDVRMEDFLPVPATPELSSVLLSMDPGTSAVPRTPSPSERLTGDKQRCLVVFFSDGQSQQRAVSFIREMEKTPNTLVRTLEVAITEQDAQRIFGTDSYAKVARSGPVIAAEYAGSDCIKSCQEIAKAIATDTGSTGMVYVSSHSRFASQQLETLFSITASFNPYPGA